MATVDATPEPAAVPVPDVVAPPVVEPPVVVAPAPAPGTEPPAQVVDPVDEYVKSFSLFDEQPAVDPNAATAPTHPVDAAAEAARVESFHLDAELQQALSTPAGRPVLAAARTLKQFSDTVMGGYMPTVEELKTAHTEAGHFEQLKAALTSGNPDSVSAALEFLWRNNNDPNAGQDPASHYTVALAEKLPEVLAKVNPVVNQKLMERYAEKAFSGFINSALAKAQAMPSGTEEEKILKDRLYDATNLAHWVLTGKEHPSARAVHAGQPVAPAADPNANLDPAIAAQLAELTEWKRAAAQRQSDSANEQARTVYNEISTAFNRQIEADAERALGPLSVVFPPGPDGKPSATFIAMRNQLISEVRDSVRNSASTVLQNITGSARRISQAGQRQAIPNLVDQYRRVYGPHLAARMAPMLKDHATALMANNATAVSRAQSLAANRNVPQGTPRPVAQPVAPVTIQRQQGETTGAFILRQVKANAGLTVRP